MVLSSLNLEAPIFYFHILEFEQLLIASKKTNKENNIDELPGVIKTVLYFSWFL